MSNNQMLLQFLIAYLNWLYAGAQGIEFKRNTGLCGNLRHYFDYSKEEVVVHMANLFEAEGLDRKYPFNINPYGFVFESDHSTMHRNINRNLWVISQIERLQHEYPLPGHPQTNQPVQMLSLQPPHQTGK